MNIGTIALIILLAIFGAVSFFAPQLCTRADKRDDPEAVSQVKKAGGAIMALAIFFALFALKYS